jgi:hypothetical protein
MKLYMRDNISLQQPHSLRGSLESQMRVRLSLSGDKQHDHQEVYFMGQHKNWPRIGRFLLRQHHGRSSGVYLDINDPLKK